MQPDNTAATSRPDKTDSDLLTGNYDAFLSAGMGAISRNWSDLSEATRQVLLTSRHFNERGKVQTLDRESGDERIERFGYALGRIQRCASVKLPERSNWGASIPEEVWSSDVYGACAEILHDALGHETPFLRLALGAIKQHELATLLRRLPAPKRPHLWGHALFLAICIALVLAAPTLVAIALVSAGHGDVGGTALALYGLGFVLWMVKTLREMSKIAPTTPDEAAYFAWSWLGPYGSGPWTMTGAGAEFYLEKMARQEIRVPPVAVDLCAALKVVTLVRR